MIMQLFNIFLNIREDFLRLHVDFFVYVFDFLPQCVVIFSENFELFGEACA